MKSKAARNYLFRDYIGTIKIYYLILVIIYLVLLALLALLNKGTNTASTSVSTWSSITPIFLFVAGLNIFRPKLNFFVQHGVSRSSYFKAFAQSSALLALLMAAIDSASGWIGIMLRSELFRLTSLSETLYRENVAEAIRRGIVSTAFSPWQILQDLAFYMGLYFFSICLGFLISLIYFRLRTLGKVVFSIAIPLAFFIILHSLTFKFFHRHWAVALGQFVSTVFGFKDKLPALGGLSFLVVAIIFLTGSWLLMRRAAVKD